MAKMCFSLVFAVLVVLHMGSNEVGAYHDDGTVLFEARSLVQLEMPGPCKGKSYCFEKGANYPTDKIDALLANMTKLKVENQEPRTDIDSRYGYDTCDEPDCPSVSTNKPIFYIIDQQGKLRVVVQSTEKFQQIYSVKWCRDEGLIERDTPHFLNGSYILKKFKIECVSAKMDFDFFVLSDEVDPVSGKPNMEIASAMGGIPVCCRCRYKHRD